MFPSEKPGRDFRRCTDASASPENGRGTVFVAAGVGRPPQSISQRRCLCAMLNVLTPVNADPNPPMLPIDNRLGKGGSAAGANVVRR